MNTIELVEMLCRYCHNFGGVFAANELSEIRNNGFYILNTDVIGQKGKHWIAMFINSELCEFFDSAGNHPSFYHKNWHKFLLQKTGAYVYNDLPFQKHNTQVCGEYCVLYIILRQHKVLFYDLISYLESVDMDRSIKKILNSMTCSSYNPKKTIAMFISSMKNAF